jgi:hypothetical protein
MDFALGIYLSEAQNPYPPPPLTHCMSVHMYTILIHTGEGGEIVELERRREGQQFTKLDRKYQHD